MAAISKFAAIRPDNLLNELESGKAEREVVNFRKKKILSGNCDGESAETVGCVCADLENFARCQNR